MSFTTNHGHDRPSHSQPPRASTHPNDNNVDNVDIDSIMQTAQPHVDEATLTKSLWTMYESTISAGGETLLSELGRHAHTHPSISDIASTQRRVRSFLTTVSPQLVSEYERVLTDIHHFILPSSTSTSTSTNPTQQQPSTKTDSKTEREDEKEIEQLLKEVASLNKTIDNLSHLKQVAATHHSTLCTLRKSFPVNLSSSLSKLDDTVRSASQQYSDCYRMYMDLYPDAAVLPPPPSASAMTGAKGTDDRQVLSSLFNNPKNSNEQQAFGQDTYRTADQVLRAGQQKSDEVLDKDIVSMCKYLVG